MIHRVEFSITTQSALAIQGALLDQARQYFGGDIDIAWGEINVRPDVRGPNGRVLLWEAEATAWADVS